MSLRALAVDIIDCIDSELEARFSQSNIELWGSMGALHPQSPQFLDVDALKPFMEYCLTIPYFNFIDPDSAPEKLRSELLLCKDILKQISIA